MRDNAIELEEARLQGIDDLTRYPWFKERHRVFPDVFEDRRHRRILDIAAGVGCTAQRIRDGYQAALVCNDICPTCLRILRRMNLPTVSFDIDDNRSPFPFPDGLFDAVISLVTIEHVINVDHFLLETRRILADQGYLYISAPNYSCPEYLLPVLLSGKTFHDPLRAESRYEFYAHVRYFTYRTLLEFVCSFGFVPEAVYLALPGGSSRYRQIYGRSKTLALAYRYSRRLLMSALPASWASEPIICLRKSEKQAGRKLRKVLL